MRQSKVLAFLALSADYYLPIDLGYLALSSVVLQCRTAADVLLCTDGQGTDYFTLKSGTSLSLDLEGGVLDINAGSNLLQNGTFASSAGWTLPTGWQVAAGVLDHNGDGTGAAVGNLTDLIPLIIGGLYCLTYTEVYDTAGVTPSIGGVTLTKRTGSGTYYEYFYVTAASTALTMTPDNTSRSTFDNISITRITYPGNQRPLFIKGSGAGLYLEVMAIQ